MEFSIKVTDKQLDVIGMALGLRPYYEVADLIVSLNRQVNEQQQRPAEPPVLDVPV